jgi:hypothetical protein
MKKGILIATLVLSSLTNFGQIIDLGTAANFVIFTTTGAVGNTGISHVTGNVGTTSGAITSFGNIDGVHHNGDSVSFNASDDLLTAYNQLNATVPTFFPGPLLGYGQRFYAGVFSIPQAATLDDCLILDAQGDSNAVFIIKIQGAFSTGPSARVSLINGALACNIFWQVEGAISMGAGTLMRGNLVANNGAIHMAVGDTLEGRAFSTTGAITMDGILAFIPKEYGSPMLTGPNKPILGSTINYAIFSSNGSVTDNGLSWATGDIGTNSGFTSGYNPANVTGTIHQIPDESTSDCSDDLLNVYNYLASLPSDIELLYPAQFGNNLVLTPHVYEMNAAVVLTDTLYLNAQGNENAVFVIKINGALTTNTYARVKLINQAQSKNIFWLINGAATINNYSVIRGTIICNNAASILNAGATVDGAIFTTSGDITTSSDTIRNLNITSTNRPNISCNCVILSTLPIELLSFTGECYNQSIILKWSTGTEINNDYFTIERSIDAVNFDVIGTVNGNGNSNTMLNYTWIDNNPINGTAYYRLKQADFNGEFEYHGIKTVACEPTTEINIYPNPFVNSFTISLSENTSYATTIEVLDYLGRKVYSQIAENATTEIILEDKVSAGTYYVKVFNEASQLVERIVKLKSGF